MELWLPEELCLLSGGFAPNDCVANSAGLWGLQMPSIVSGG